MLGFQTPIIQSPLPGAFSADTTELAQPALYKVIDFTQHNRKLIEWAGQITIAQSGQLSALRFVTKNMLAIKAEDNSTIDWLNHYMALPIARPFKVDADDVMNSRFSYRASVSIGSLQNAIEVEVINHQTLHRPSLSLATV